MPNVGDPTYAVDVIADIGSTDITADTSTTSGTTESGALVTVTANLISGETYWVELSCNIVCDNATAVPIGARIRENNSTGNQIGFSQIYFASTASTGFAMFVRAKYVAVATGSKTFVVTLQRNGGSTGAYNITAASARPGYLIVRRSID